jgi:hypothetical protein
MVRIFEIALRNCAIADILVCQPFNVVGKWERRELLCHLFHLASECRVGSPFDLSDRDLGDRWGETLNLLGKRLCERFLSGFLSSNSAEITEVSRYIFSFLFMNIPV